MNSSVSFLTEQVIDRVLTSGRITALDRQYFLQAAMTEAPMDSDLSDQVKVVCDRLKMGLLKVVD
jgi:hypothetical protein